MERNMVFCEACRDDVCYTVDEIQTESTLKGEVYKHTERIAHCADCGAQVHVPELHDSNLRALYDVFREKKGLISLDKIQEIPQKYNIGKRPLSLLLGWGEHTYSRYYDGDVPKLQYSEILQKIYDSPQYYADILESNKENLLNDSAYTKSASAVNALLNVSPKVAKIPKITLVIEYLLNQCEDITQLALQKALYYVQGFHHAFYNTFLFSEDCEAWVHGPVYREIYAKYRGYCFDTIDGVAQFDSTVFSASEKAILDSVIKNICCYSGKTLEQFTHAEAPWIKTRGALPTGTNSNAVIQKELIGSFFLDVKSNYNMLSPSDIGTYTQQMFTKL